MDSLTHLAMGHAMGVFASGSTPAVQAGAYWGALVGNSLPDIDVPLGYLLGKGWGLHRKFTHTAPGIVVLSLAATGIITVAIPGSSPLQTLVWTLAGCVVHVLLDCHNLFGVRPLWPLSERRVGFGVLFILDPIILATLGLGGAAHLAGWVPAAVLRGLYVGVWGYISLRWWQFMTLKRRLKGPGTAQVSLIPWLLSWRYVRQTEAGLEYGKVEPLTGRALPVETIQPARGPEVEASRRDPRVEAFLRHARYPFAQVERVGERYRVVWHDLYLRIRGVSSGIEIVLNQNLHPEEPA